MKNYSRFKFPLLLLVLSFVFSSCSEEEEATPQQPINDKPWEIQVNMGWFNINSGAVVTNQDGQNVDILDDYVLKNDLPQVGFELMGLNVLIPTSENFSTSVTQAKVEMRSDLGTTGNIFNDDLSKFKERVTIDGVIYSVYEVYGFYNGSAGAITPDNFQNITYTLIVEYEQDDEVVRTRTVTLGIYKREN